MQHALAFAVDSKLLEMTMDKHKAAVQAYKNRVDY